MTTPRPGISSEPTPIVELLEHPTPALLSTTSQVLIFGLCWIGIGLATAIYLRRRAHEFPPNAALGIILGPLFIFLAYDMIRRRETEKPIALSPPSNAEGSTVLVVAVGDLEQPGAVLEAVRGLGPVGPIIVAVPVEYEIAQRVHSLGASPPPSDQLTQLAKVLAEFEPGLMMLPGQVEKSIPSALKTTGSEMVLLVGSESQAAASALGEDVQTRVVSADK